jgi:hypothetical protein
MHSTNIPASTGKKRSVQNAAMSVLLCLGMLLACLCPPTRMLAEEEIETPHCVGDRRSQAIETRSPLVRLPAPLVIRAQGRAIDSGVETRHGNNDVSRRNGIGANLLI